MKVLVLTDGKTALKQNQCVCVINGLQLYSEGINGEGRQKSNFYGVNSYFFKIACPPGTEHDFETLPDGKINLI